MAIRKTSQEDTAQGTYHIDQLHDKIIDSIEAATSATIDADVLEDTSSQGGEPPAHKTRSQQQPTRKGQGNSEQEENSQQGLQLRTKWKRADIERDADEIRKEPIERHRAKKGKEKVCTTSTEMVMPQTIYNTRYRGVKQDVVPESIKKGTRKISIICTISHSIPLMIFSPTNC